MKNRTTYYVEESFDVLSGVVMRADPVLSDLVSTVKQFERHVAAKRLTKPNNNDDMNSNMFKGLIGSNSDLLSCLESDRDLAEEERRRLKVSFHSLEEIEELRAQLNNSGGLNQHYVRSSLGLVKHDEDWIFSINIGNVMSMAPLSVDELATNNGVKSETYHEVARDSMLEKIILISIAYFCIATEMRFLAKAQAKDLQGQSEAIYKSPYYKDSEAYHAKSLHIAA